MKECKNIYELKDILYEKFDYWDVVDLTRNIKRIADDMADKQIEDAVEEQRSQTAYWQERAEDAETERDDLQDEVNELRKKLEEYEQDDGKVIPF